MEISQIKPLTNIKLKKIKQKQTEKTQKSSNKNLTKPSNKSITKSLNKDTFDNTLKDTISKVNDSINLNDEQAEKILAGENQNLEEYLVNMQKTEMSLDLTLEVRNKIVDAYKEIMRMQV